MRQVGSDRVIEILFSEGKYRLYLEFFAAGNIVLTDADLNVLALLRQVSEGNEDVDVKLGSRYVLEQKQNYNGIPPVTEERTRAVLKDAASKLKEAQEAGGKKAKNSKRALDLRRALSAGFSEYPSHLLEHTFLQTGVDPDWKIDEVLDSPGKMERILQALSNASDVYASLEGTDLKGYIIAKTKPGFGENEEDGSVSTPPRDSLLYDDFHPFRPSQFENRQGMHILEFDGFNKTVDEFYSSIESQKLESRLNEREQQAEQRLQAAKDEQAKRLGALQHVQELHIRKAQAIEANTHRVEEACAAVNGLIGQGMDWVDIGKLIENEQKRGNTVGQMVKLPLRLEENTVTLLLDEPVFEEDEDEGYGSDRTEDEYDSEDEDTTSKKANQSSEQRLTIDIDLALGPWQNARLYYDEKKRAAAKEQKTMQASSKALKSTEKKIQEDLKKGLKQEKAVLRPARKQFWFEKFLWFISSDGYLVIGGKDAQQNELLYRRYLKKGDVYVHADLQGASSVIVKNNPQTPDAPIPPSTLSQAGALTVCTSTAWDSKAVMAAWWVNAEQVSKTAETGEYLQTGGFVVRGKKNFLPPSQLLLGFGVVWLTTEESRANHGKHRVTRAEEVSEGQVDELTEETGAVTLDGEADDLEGDSADVVPDVEDAANDAEKEIEQDDEAMNDGAQNDIDDDDENAIDNSDDDNERIDDNEQRANPLQANSFQASPANAKGDHSSEDSPSEPEDEDDAETGTPDPSTTTSTRPDNPLSSVPSAPPSIQPTKSSQQPKRGKRSKQKRAAKKYADQSDDDRALAMDLLGSNKTAERKQVVEEEKAAAEAKREADRERRRKQHQRAAERERVRQERIARGEAPTPASGGDVGGGANEEIDAEQALQELQEHKNIDLLVPAPDPGDELLAAIPVVAPWTALSRNKYKVKLQPGSMKKGKAVKEIVGMWSGLDKVGAGGKGRKIVDESNSDREKVWAKEVELIKAWRVEEVVGCVPVKGCRIVQGGGILGSASAGGGGGKGSGKGGAQKGKGGSGKGGKKGR